MASRSCSALVHAGCACHVLAVSLMLTCGSVRTGDAADVADAGPAIWRPRSLGAAVIDRVRLALPPGCPGTCGSHSDAPAHSGDRCRFVLRPVTPAASGVLAAADPGLPMGSQTDIPWRYIDDRCGAAVLQVEGGRCCRAGPCRPACTRPVRRTAATSRALTRYRRRLPRAGWCSGHGAAVRRVCRHQRRDGEAASYRRQSGALDSDFH